MSRSSAQTSRNAAAAAPDVVNIQQCAELAGLTHQRIYQDETDWRAGRRDDSPAPILEGYGLRSSV